MKFEQEFNRLWGIYLVKLPAKVDHQTFLVGWPKAVSYVTGKSHVA